MSMNTESPIPVAPARTPGRAPIRVQRAADAMAPAEYGCLLRRVLPSRDLAEEAPWGTAWATVLPGTATDPHGHDEEEIFIVLHGEGILRIGDEDVPLAAGDAVRIPRHERHTFRNESSAPLQFLSIYWDGEPVYRAR